MVGREESMMQQLESDGESELGKKNNSLPVRPRHATQYLAALAGCLGAMGSGTIMGFSSPAGPQLVPAINTTDYDSFELTLSSGEYSWFSAVPNIAAAVVGPVAGLAINKIGRRGTMLVSVIPFIVGWLFVGLADALWSLLLGRIFGGICLGSVSVVVPIFIGEFASPDIRGLLGAGFQLLASVGLLLTYIVGSFVNWRILAGVSLSIPVLYGLTTLSVPESPTYLIIKEQDEHAEKALRWLRGKEYDVDSELQAVKKNIQELQAAGKVGLMDLSRPYIMRPLMISLGLMFFQQLCGINAILFNANTIFQDSGSSLGQEASSIVVATTQTLGTLLASVIMDRAGRRVLLLLSSAVMAVALVTVGVYFYIKEKDEAYATGTLGWLPLVGLVVFMVAFSLAYGPIPWLMMGELFPRDAREIAGSLASSLNWTLSFIVTLGFGPLQEAIGSYSVYWMFASMCILSFFFCFFVVPETKGRTLEEITQMFGGPTTSEKDHH